MEPYGIPQDPSLRTKSWFRAMYLRSIWGYRILEVRRRPRAGWFGTLAYDESYLLLPGSKEAH